MAFFSAPGMEKLYSGGDEDQRVEGLEGLIEGGAGRVAGDGHARGDLLGEQGQVEGGDVDELGIDALDLVGLIDHPLGDGATHTVGADGTDDAARRVIIFLLVKIGRVGPASGGGRPAQPRCARPRQMIRQ